HLPATDRLLWWRLMEGGASFLLLMVPATAMGAGFALVLRAGRAVGSPVALLYGVNALGGTIGALLPLWLLPAFGWSGALGVVVALGLLIASVAWWSAGRLAGDGAADGGVDASRARSPLSWIDLVAYAGVGAAALMVEVGWVRLYGMVLLRTEYLLALVLALIVAGIGLGSLLARARWLACRFSWLPWIAAGGILLSLMVWPSIGRWAGRADFSSLGAALAAQGGVLALVLLPTTLALGAWLPLLAGRLRQQGGDTPRRAALLYGANSIGAALGAVVGGLLLVPSIGTPATLIVAATLLLLCAMRWCGHGPLRFAFLLLPLVAAPWWRMPPAAELTPALAGTVDRARFEDAVNVTHVVQRPDGQRLLLADLQRMDAASDPTSVAVQKNQARLPLLFHPHPRRVLFLGLGTGITAAGSLPWPGLERTAVELSPGAIRAAGGWFRPVNGGVVDRLRIVHDDVRRFLRRDRRRYDVIVGDLFHPDMAGRGALLSLEQFRRVRRRLAPGGIFVQWIALNQFDVANLRVMFATFRRVFPHGLLFVDGYRLALFARPDAPLAPPAAPPAGGDGGEGVASWMARLWGPVPRLDARPQSEWWPVIEYALPRARYRGVDALVGLWRWLLRFRVADRQAAALLHLPPARMERFRRARRAALANVRGWIADLQGDARAADRYARDAWRWNPHNRWASFAVADRLMAAIEAGRLPPGVGRKEALRQLLAIRPDHLAALEAMVSASADDPRAAARWRARIRQVAPLARLP
ncbi:MAG: spermine synthase, partial [Zetaproteobacteria bacterium]